MNMTNELNSKIDFPIRAWQLIWYAVICMLGTTGNALVIYLAFSNKNGGIHRRAPFNVYLVALAITDLLISVFCIPIYLLSTDVFDHPGGEGGDWMCKIITGYFFPFWMLDISAFLLVGIALERRRAILEPFSSLREPNITRTLSAISGIVILSIITQAPTIYGSHYALVDADIGSSCIYAYDNLLMEILHYITFILKCFTPSVIFAVCFYQIHKSLSKKSSNLNTSLGAYRESNVFKEKVHNSVKRTKQTVNTMRLVVIAFIVCVTINEVFFMFLKPVLSATNVQWNSQVYQFTVMLRFSNSAINPLLYAFKSQVFRKRFKDTFGIVSNKRPSSTPKIHPCKGKCRLERNCSPFKAPNIL